MENLAKISRNITAKVRELRRSRRWTQAELAKHLRLSQGRLSQIERGQGSLTAEQFLVVLRLFNVSVSHFVGGGRADGRRDEAELQNALVRLGAKHLRENDRLVPDERLEDFGTAIREALVAGSPRLIAALAPVIVGNIERVNLWKVFAELAEAGLDRRFGWVVESTWDAVNVELKRSLPRSLEGQYRRAGLLLAMFLAFAKDRYRGATPAGISPPDVLDRDIRSAQTLRLAEAETSEVARVWGVVTGLRVEDFVEALRGAQENAGEVLPGH